MKLEHSKNNKEVNDKEKINEIGQNPNSKKVIKITGIIPFIIDISAKF